MNRFLPVTVVARTTKVQPPTCTENREIHSNRIGIKLDQPWSSFVEGYEQLDQPNSQTCMDGCHVCVAEFFWFVINTTAYHFDRCSLHLV